MSQSQSQGGETKRQLQKRKAREYVAKFDDFEAKARESTQDAVKTDDIGRQTFEDLCNDFTSIQEKQNTDSEAKGCAAAAVRGASAMVRIAQIGLKRSKNIAQGGSGFSVKDFIKNLVTRFPGSDNNADGSCLDWKENAKVAVEFFATTPTAICLSHPLGKNFEPKQRKSSVRQQKNKDAEEVRPLFNCEDTVTDERNPEKRKQQLAKLIKSWKDDEEIPLAKLIVDPKSFGETCENLFACSFLVERNDLALTLDSQGRFMAKKVVVTDNNVHETENIVRDVLKMDWEVYDRLVKELFPQGKAGANPYFKFDPSLPDEMLKRNVQ